jgi:itaconate CoA-transferase
MFDVMADWLTVPLLHQEAGKPPPRIGPAHPSIAPYGVFATRDGKQTLISIQSDREWTKFCAEFLKAPALASDERFAKNVGRVRNRAATDEAVATAFASFDETQAKEALLRADVAFASVNDMATLSSHPHLRRVTVETPAGPVAFPAPAPIVLGVERAYGSVPAIGEHTPLDGQERQTS